MPLVPLVQMEWGVVMPAEVLLLTPIPGALRQFRLLPMLLGLRLVCTPVVLLMHIIVFLAVRFILQIQLIAITSQYPARNFILQVATLALMDLD